MLLRRRRPRVPPARAALARAEDLMRAGRYRDALPIYQRLGQEAEQRGLAEAAANLFLQASRCLAELDRAEEASDEALHAIDLLAQAGRPGRIRAVTDRTAQTLESKGHSDLAARMRQEAEKRLAGMPEAPTGPRRPMRAAAIAARLPDKCPACGAPVIPTDLTWVSPGVGQCTYCGGIIKPQLPESSH